MPEAPPVRTAVRPANRLLTVLPSFGASPVGEPLTCHDPPFWSVNVAEESAVTI